MKKLSFPYLLIISLTICSACEDISDNQDLKWSYINTGKEELAIEKTIYEETFDRGSDLRENQSMCIWGGKAFCFNDGKVCKVLDMESKKWLYSEPLPVSSHQNNAQFLNTYYEEEDKYPLMLLSRGDYPPSSNNAYIVRVSEVDNLFSFSIVKTIHNSIKEAQNGGCWIIDEENNKIYLYCMTLSDWRLKDGNNKFCVYSFSLPDISTPEDVSFGYEDVLDKWEYTYLIHQGGTFYNGFLFFNVGDMESYEGINIASDQVVIAINTRNGRIEAIMPLRDYKETEGICVYNNMLYITFKKGSKQQYPANIVFSLKEYTLPTSIVTRNNEEINMI